MQVYECTEHVEYVHALYYSTSTRTSSTQERGCRPSRGSCSHCMYCDMYSSIVRYVQAGYVHGHDGRPAVMCMSWLQEAATASTWRPLTGGSEVDGEGADRKGIELQYEYCTMPFPHESSLLTLDDPRPTLPLHPFLYFPPSMAAWPAV